MHKAMIALAVAASLSTTAVAADNQQQQLNLTAEQLAQLLQQMEQLQQRVTELEAKLAEQQQPQHDTEVLAPRQEIHNDSAITARVENLEEQLKTAQNAPITIGGAVRFQYAWDDYSAANQDRGGDFDFDLFRLDYSGTIGDVILSAQYRWFQYMNTIQHAWVGYNFSEQWQGQVGITKVPFGIMPYNSNSYFFSSNFYVGLEDDHDSGIKLLYRDAQWDFDIAYFKNDEQGGIDGGASNRFDRYAYDALGVRLSGEGVYDTPNVAISEHNTLAVRVARKYSLAAEQSLEWGLSAQSGKLVDSTHSVGSREAFAVHGVYRHNNWTVMTQVSDYRYHIDDISEDGIVVGAYAFYDTIPSKARLYTANIAYSMPVQIGPVSNLTFYNDYSLMTNKSGGYADTVMNVLGVAVSAGGLYTYIDWVTAKNQPFIGGTMVGNDDSTKTRININFGYYF